MENVNIEEQKIEVLEDTTGQETERHDTEVNATEHCRPEENTATAEVEVKKETKKPYEFKQLDFDNMFPMINLIDKIGIEKVVSLTDNEAIMNLIQGKKPMKLDEEGNEVVDNDAQMKLLASAFVAIGGLLIKSIKSCRNEIYEVLSSASNLSVEEISKLPIKYSYSMIYDFIKKDDFKDFFMEVMDSFETK